MEEFTTVLQTGRSARAVGVLGKFLGRTVGETAAFAAGVAIGPVLGPIVQALRNTTNSHYAFVYPDPVVLADGVAQGQIPEKQARLWASFHGIGDDAFTALVNIANTGPGVSEAYLLWRRGEINEAGFRRAAKRTGLEQEWIEALVKAKDVLLSSQELAMMQQQGFVSQARANSEGALQGVTNERQQLRYDVSGLPPGVGEALQMLRRKIITAAEFAQIVREGHTKTKYTDELLALKDQVLHATDYAGLRIRGWISAEESYAGGALTGYGKEDMDRLFQNRGRPATTHQVFIGMRRGGKVGGPTTGIDPDFLKAVQQSDIRPEYANPLWAGRFTYPAAFVLRTLASSGDLTQAETEEILLFEGWEPTLAKKVSIKWSAGTATTQRKETAAHLALEYGSGHISDGEYVAALKELGYSDQAAALEVDLTNWKATKKYRDKAIDKVASRFIGLQFSEAEARQALADLTVPARATELYLRAWSLERDDEGTSLSQAQVGKAYKKGLLTLDAATARLGDLGMLPADAALYLGSV